MMNLLHKNSPRKPLFVEQWEGVLDIDNHFNDTYMCLTIENDLISFERNDCY